MTGLRHLTGEMMKAAVIGDPVARSSSPAIMNRWLAATATNGIYTAFHVPAETLKTRLAALHDLGFAGLNVTMPLKEAVIASCHSLSARAEAAGAVNLMIRDEAGWRGDNTDIDGIAGPLSAIAGAPQKALVLGAGGAARGAVLALRQLHIRDIHVAARRSEAAKTFADRFGGDLTPCTWDEAMRGGHGADLLINSTPIDMQDNAHSGWPDSLYDGVRRVFDMVYAPHRTAFIRGAASRNCITHDGFDMLVAQARPAFAAIFGKNPPEDPDLPGLLRAKVQASP